MSYNAVYLWLTMNVWLFFFIGPKLFVKPSSKSNRHIIINAISQCVLAGPVNADQKNKILEVHCNIRYIYIWVNLGCLGLYTVYSWKMMCQCPQVYFFLILMKTEHAKYEFQYNDKSYLPFIMVSNFLVWYPWDITAYNVIGLKHQCCTRILTLY